jgi:DNA-binding NarL/FixJ family response regulator
MALISVFIIEDHNLLRQTWVSFLTKRECIRIAGHTGNGEDALRIIKKDIPDVVLLDIRMLPLDGFKVLDALLKMNPGIKVIGLSLHVRSCYVDKMLGMGAMGYLTKNCSIEELVKAIREVYNGNKYISDEVKHLIDEERLSDQERFSNGIE